MRRFWILALLAALPACRSTETVRQISSREVAPPLRAAPIQAWSVRSEDDEVGGVVRYEDPRSPGDVLYVVRNVWSQDLGVIDRLGRAYRFLPHHRDPAWVGTGTLRMGVERILGRPGCVLVEAPLERPAPGSR